MPYTTEADLVEAAGDLDRLNQLVQNRTPPTGTGDARQYWVDAAIRHGDASVNTILAPRFKTPIASPSDALKKLAAAEAIFWLVDSRGHATADEQASHKARLKRLKAWRDSEEWPSDPLPATTASPQGRTIANDTKVSRVTMEGFV